MYSADSTFECSSIERLNVRRREDSALLWHHSVQMLPFWPHLHKVVGLLSVQSVGDAERIRSICLVEFAEQLAEVGVDAVLTVLRFQALWTTGKDLYVTLTHWASGQLKTTVSVYRRTKNTVTDIYSWYSVNEWPGVFLRFFFLKFAFVPKCIKTRLVGY